MHVLRRIMHVSFQNRGNGDFVKPAPGREREGAAGNPAISLPRKRGRSRAERFSGGRRPGGGPQQAAAGPPRIGRGRERRGDPAPRPFPRVYSPP
jgi:hypothetical protein